jgi:hypothetical protein
MAVFLFDFIAILLFWKLADRSQLRTLFPLMMMSLFIRFLDHFILIDWLKIWTIFGPPMMQFWIPVSANLTVWPVALFLFFQYLPQKRRLLYSALWVAIMLMYLQLLLWLHVFTMGEKWTMFHSAGAVSMHFLLMYWAWYWLTQQSAKKRQAAKQVST